VLILHSDTFLKAGDTLVIEVEEQVRREIHHIRNMDPWKGDNT
jgi:hypothetical protein